MQPIFDRTPGPPQAPRIGADVEGASFLLDRAVDDLGERLATVERRFDKAAALFCLTRAARDAILATARRDR